MAGKNSLLEDLYTDSGGFDADRAAEVRKQLLTIQRGSKGDIRRAAFRERNLRSTRLKSGLADRYRPIPKAAPNRSFRIYPSHYQLQAPRR